ncbi:MAG: NnrS family protein [Kangiella sp.]|nr:NnrS family protein [Kangiella sp.]
MQILDSKKENAIWPLFRLGFRVFFLGGALVATLSMLLWIMQLNGHNLLPGIQNSIWWHAHEMLFGFTLAIIAGFVLTAMQNWTGIPGVRGWPLAIASCLWFLPRVLLPFLGEKNWLVMTLDISWLPLVAIFLARPVIQVKQWRNLFFVPLMLLFTILNALSYYAAYTDDWLLAERIFITAVLAITALITVMGGRVIPFFTSRATNTEKPMPILALEWVCLGSIWLATFAWLLLPRDGSMNMIVAALMILAAVANIVRILRWKTIPALKVPLLWILHLGYWFIPVGLLVFASALLEQTTTYSNASHLLTAGALGSVVLGMIARVSLGHSGRPLQPSKWMTVAFAIVLLAGLIRGLTALVAPTYVADGYQVSGILWILAYGLFVIFYWPVLTKPRVDGRPG